MHVGMRLYPIICQSDLFGERLHWMKHQRLKKAITQSVQSVIVLVFFPHQFIHYMNKELMQVAWATSVLVLDCAVYNNKWDCHAIGLVLIGKERVLLQFTFGSQSGGVARIGKSLHNVKINSTFDRKLKKMLPNKILVFHDCFIWWSKR